MKQHMLLGIIGAGIMAAVSFTQAGIIVESPVENPEYSAMTSGAASGQSLHTPIAASSWDHLTFNFFRTVRASDGRPLAVGTLFLLEQEYLGSANGLSTITPGYLSHTAATQSEAGGLEWVFPTNVTLNADQDYWFFMNGASGSETGDNISVSNGASPNGDFYYSIPLSENFLKTPLDSAFQLEGTMIPEPTTFMFSGIGVFIFLIRSGLRRRDTGVSPLFSTI